MKVYRVYGGKVVSVDVKKETNLYYWFHGSPAAFQFSTRIEKEYACVTPQEAIQEAFNSAKTRRGEYLERLAEIEQEMANLKELEQAYST